MTEYRYVLVNNQSFTSLGHIGATTSYLPELLTFATVNIIDIGREIDSWDGSRANGAYWSPLTLIWLNKSACFGSLPRPFLSLHISVLFFTEGKSHGYRYFWCTETVCISSCNFRSCSIGHVCYLLTVILLRNCGKKVKCMLEHVSTQ